MPTVFVSYRRGSTTAVVHRLAERLGQVFGAGNVFLDVESLPPGEDFRTQIRTEIARCQCAVVVIGPDWVGATAAGRRIDDPADFVRLEVEELLSRGIPVVPVLADRTPMPTPDLLPESLRPLAFRHAEPLDSGLDFSAHVERLCRKLLGDAPMSPPNKRWPAPTVISCVVAVAAVVVAVALLNRPKVDPPAAPQVTTTGDGSPVVVNTGNNSKTIINPPDKETPRAIKELAEQQKEEARKAEEQRKKKEADDEARRKADDARKEREAKAEADRKYREAIKPQVNDILALARLHSGQPAELERYLDLLKSVGTPTGRGKTYSALGLILAEQKKHAEARAAFRNADAQYKTINDDDMRRWVAEQTAGLPTE
jgi:hypothetical protein